MKIYVGNLSPEVTENDLRELFITYGDLKSVSLITDRATGESRGFAFVEMPDEAARAAIEGANETEFKGKVLSVNQARERESTRPSFERGGGFGGRNKGGRGFGGGGRGAGGGNRKRGGGRSNRGQNRRGGY